jgi:DNA-binding NarL/FixJ family response regulator
MSVCEQSKVRVLIVDDHELTRFSLSLVLQNQQDFELVGLANNGQEAIELVRQKHPDVIILDLQMPIMDGLSASTYIKTIDPNTQILAYSSLEDCQTDIMVQTGRIDAFCRKDTDINALIALVRQLGQSGCL